MKTIIRGMIAISLFFILTPVSVSIAGQKIDGKEVFENRCSNICHKPPVPEALSPKQWKAVLKTMQTRMDFNGIEPLDRQETKSLYNWLIQKR